jgi:hypothetical protein
MSESARLQQSVHLRAWGLRELSSAADLVPRSRRDSPQQAQQGQETWEQEKKEEGRGDGERGSFGALERSGGAPTALNPCRPPPSSRPRPSPLPRGDLNALLPVPPPAARVRRALEVVERGVGALVVLLVVLHPAALAALARALYGRLRLAP